jgi:hypothetical protein
LSNECKNLTASLLGKIFTNAILLSKDLMSLSLTISIIPFGKLSAKNSVDSSDIGAA